MKSTIIRLAVVAMAYGYALPALGQGDSSHLDAGYLTLNKSLTPVLSIKGEDLEKMPFANLSDAIAAWLYGAYTQPATLLYIVDGSPAADVNAYSVFDIEEVMLVENAAAMLYTGGGQQEVVLIRTRRGKGKAGMTAAVQTGLVNGDAKGVSTDTRWYHQYYVGANINPGAWRFGASADWLRDVQPVSGAYQIVTPDNLQRWRLHGYADWRPDRHQQLEVAMGYAPEKFRMGTDSTEQQDFSASVRNSASQRFFLPELRWHGEWLGGLTNQLQASYVRSVYQGTELEKSVSDTSSDYYYEVSIGGHRSSYHVYVRDRLAYSLAYGGWCIEPAMSVSYEHAEESFGVQQFTDQLDGPGSFPYAASEAAYLDDKYHLLFYTPQGEIHYKKGFDLEGGGTIQAGLSGLPPGSKKTFFFISSSFDVLRLGNENSSSGLVFFGSYAQRATPPLPGYQLADLTYGYSNDNLFGSNNSFAIIGNQNIYYAAASPTQRFWVWEAGVRYIGWKDRLQIQGNIERRNYALLDYIPVAAGGNNTSIDVANLVASDMLLHLGGRVEVLEGAVANWQSGINATVLRSKITDRTSVAAEGGLAGYTGDVYPNPYSVTGGWVNRVQVRHFIGGVDLLYHFGERYFETGPVYYPAVVGKLSSVAVPNIYAGYRFGPAHKGAEVFAESRGLVHSKSSDLLGDRRYYTVGGKVNL